MGVYERGRERVGFRFDDDAAACQCLYDELVFAGSPPAVLGAEEEREGERRTAELRSDIAARIRRAQRSGTVVAVPYLLQAGLLLDQFGQESGSYLYPDGTPYAQRSLPPSMLNTTDPRFPYGYHRYRVVRSFRVRAGFVAPAFGQPGGGVQFKTEAGFFTERPALPTVLWLLRAGYLQRVDSPGRP